MEQNSAAGVESGGAEPAGSLEKYLPEPWTEILLFLGFAAWITWPLLPHLGEYIQGKVDELHNYHTIAWLLHAWGNDLPLSRMNTFGNNAPSYFLSEQFGLIAIFAWCLTKAGLSLTAAFNSLYLVFLVLNCLAAFLLARRFVSVRALAACAALYFIYGYCAAFDIHRTLIRIPLFMVPFSVIAYFNCVSRNRRVDFVTMAVCLLVTILLPVGYLMMTATVLLICLMGSPPRSRQSLAGLAISAVPAAALAAVMAWRYRNALREMGVSVTPAGFAEPTFSLPVLLGTFMPGHLITLLAACAILWPVSRPDFSVPAPFRLRPLLAAILIAQILGLLVLSGTGLLGKVTIERDGLLAGSLWFSGTLLALILLLPFPFRRWERIWAEWNAGQRTLCLLTLFGIAFTLHHVYRLGPFYFAYGFVVGLQAWFPPIGFVRKADRFSLLVAMALPVLTFSWLCLKSSNYSRRVQIGIIAIVVAITIGETAQARGRYRYYRENQIRIAYSGGRERDIPETGPWIPDVYRWMKKNLDPGMLLELPLSPSLNAEMSSRAAYFSTYHWFPLLNGYSSFEPAGYLEMLLQLERPEMVGIRGFRELGAHYVIVHSHRLTAVEKKVYLSVFGDCRREVFKSGIIDDWLVDLGSCPAAIKPAAP